MFVDFLFLVAESMKLSPNVGSDRSWVYNVLADISDGEPKAELLAIRFANAERKEYCGINDLFTSFFNRCQPLQGTL